MEHPVLEEPDFHRAARLGDIATLERLLAEGADIDVRADLEEDNGSFLRGLTPLMVAARSIDGAGVETLAWLLQQGANLYATSEGGVTAAWYAAGNGGRCEFHPWRLVSDHMDRLRFLLDAGLNPHETADNGESLADNGRSLLVEACSIGDPACVRLLLERGVPPVPVFPPPEETTQDKMRRMMEAHGVSESLIARHSRPRVGDYPSYQIPLFQAAASGSAECVRLLLDAGADPNMREERGATALAYAGSPDVVRVLTAAGAQLDVMARDDRDDVLDLVLEGVACDGDLCGPGRFAVAQALLDAGVPLERTDGAGWTRLYRAAFRHQADTVAFLLSKGASLAPDKHNGTPLHAICWQGEYQDPEINGACERIIRALVAAGVPIEARDDEGRTPLHKATGGDWANPTAVRTLLELGAETDPVDGYGQTPLHIAAKNGAVACIEALLDAEADPMLPDNEGRTPTDLAENHHGLWVCIAEDDAPNPYISESPEERQAWNTKKAQGAMDAITLLRNAARRPV
jgi:ankyrin repeat protein